MIYARIEIEKIGRLSNPVIDEAASEERLAA
jgi:hypothetical protein